MKVKISDLGNIITGNTPSKKIAEYYDSNDICFVKPDSLSDKIITILRDTSEYISENARAKARIVEKDAVLVTCIGSIGKIGLTVKGEYAFNQQINAILPNNKILPKYLAYNLLFNKNRLIDLANAPVVPIINKTQFGDFEIKIETDTRIQDKIVQKLDKVLQIINQRQQELDKLDELVKARFVEMFGDPITNPYEWVQTSLKNVAIGKLSYGSGASAIGYDNEVRYVRITDITDSGELNNDIKSPNSFDAKYLLNDGDILFARSGATVGKTFIHNSKKYGKCIYAGYLIRLVPDLSKVVPDYVFWFTKTDYYMSFVSQVQRAVAQPNINAQEYGNLTICVPPIELQNQFADFVKQIDKSKVAVQKALDEAQLLFDSLMQEYFG